MHDVCVCCIDTKNYSLFGKISSFSEEVVNAEDDSTWLSSGAGFLLPVSIASHNCNIGMIIYEVMIILLTHIS